MSIKIWVLLFHPQLYLFYHSYRVCYRVTLYSANQEECVYYSPHFFRGGSHRFWAYASKMFTSPDISLEVWTETAQWISSLVASVIDEIEIYAFQNERQTKTCPSGASSVTSVIQSWEITLIFGDENLAKILASLGSCWTSGASGIGCHIRHPTYNQWR